MPVKKAIAKIKQNIKASNERSARQTLLEELFNDFNRSRVQVYKMNLVRGILFGAGSVIGGTIVIALLVWLLSLLGSVVPFVGDYFDSASQTLESRDE